MKKSIRDLRVYNCVQYYEHTIFSKGYVIILYNIKPEYRYLFNSGPFNGWLPNYDDCVNYVDFISLEREFDELFFKFTVAYNFNYFADTNKKKYTEYI